MFRFPWQRSTLKGIKTTKSPKGQLLQTKSRYKPSNPLQGSPIIRLRSNKSFKIIIICRIVAKTASCETRIALCHWTKAMVRHKIKYKTIKAQGVNNFSRWCLIKHRGINSRIKSSNKSLKTPKLIELLHRKLQTKLSVSFKRLIIVSSSSKIRVKRQRISTRR